MEFNKKYNEHKKIENFNYKFFSFSKDFFQTIIWFSFSLYLIFFLNISNYILYIVIVCLFLLSIFFIYTLIKNLTKIILTDEGILKKNPFQNIFFKWDDISEIKLKYYSTRRDKEKGWMILYLLKQRKKMTIHSSISDFNVILEKIGSKTDSNKYLFNYNTQNNFKAMGINLYNREN